MNDNEIHDAALRQKSPFWANHILVDLELNKQYWGTHVWRILQNMVDEGLLERNYEGYWVVENES